MISDFLQTSSLYSNPSFPYIMFTVNKMNCDSSEPGCQYLHWHEELQYTLVTKGTLTMQVNGLIYHLSCGDAIFINRGFIHVAKNLSQDGEYVSFNFSSKMLSIFHGSLLDQNYVQPYTANHNYPVLLFSAKNRRHHNVLHILNEMKKANSRLGEYGMSYYISSLLISLWAQTILLFNCASAKPNKAQNIKQEYLRLMVSFIHHNYSSNISLNDIAGAAHISISESSRCFKNTLHVTPYEYLLNFRIAKSKELLAATNYSVAEIATMSGFNDSSHFIQYFKKIQKQTPNKYRDSL